jgi:hypothetical protein
MWSQERNRTMATKEQIASNLNSLTLAINSMGKALSTQLEHLTKLVDDVNARLGDVELTQSGLKQQSSDAFFGMTQLMEAMKLKMNTALAAPSAPAAYGPTQPSGAASVTFNIPMGQVLKALMPDDKDPDAIALAVNPGDPSVLSPEEKTPSRRIGTGPARRCRTPSSP